MIHLFTQKNKEIFIEGDEALVNDLQPELAKRGIKASKYFPNDSLKKKIILAPVSTDELLEKDRYHVFCINDGNTEKADAHENTITGSLRDMIPELCRIVYRICL